MFCDFIYLNGLDVNFFAEINFVMGQLKVFLYHTPLLSRFNHASAGAGVAICSVMMFVIFFYTGEQHLGTCRMLCEWPI